MRLLRAVLAMTVVAAGQLLFQAGPAFACSCQADVQVADALATSDGAFVGVLTGRDDPLAAGPLVSSGRPVVNHSEVERSVKGGIGERVDVEAAAGGASCGLEVPVGKRVGLLLQRSAAGWTSSLCSQTEPDALLALAPRQAAAAQGGEEPSERGFRPPAPPTHPAPMSSAPRRRRSTDTLPNARRSTPCPPERPPLPEHRAGSTS